MNAKMIYTDLLKPTTTVNEQQLDEISLDQVGRGIGGLVGGIGKTAGAVAGIPQGLGRAIKKGYRGSVKGIGGEDDAGSLVPGAAYGDTSGAKAGGKAEMPIGSNTINPRTGKPYVPSDFSGPSGGSATATPAPAASGGGGGAAATRDADTVKTELRNLDAAYKTRRNALNKELESLSSAPAGGAGTEPTAEPATGALGSAIAGTPTGDKPETVSIGGQKISPSDPLYAKIAASQVMQNKPLVQSIQALDAKQLEIVKQILSKKAAGALEEGIGSMAKGAVQGMKNFAKGTALGATNPTAARNLSKNPNTGAMTKAGRYTGIGAKKAYDLTKRGLAATGSAIAATPRALSTAAGATRGAFTGMSQAYAKGKQAGTKYVGQGELSWDDIQVELANLSVEDAKALLSFVNQLGVTAPAAAPAAKKKAAGSGAAGKVPGYKGPLPSAVPAIPKPPKNVPYDPSNPEHVKLFTDTSAREEKLRKQRNAAKARNAANPTVHESLTWSKNFDPSRHLIKQIRRT